MLTECRVIYCYLLTIFIPGLYPLLLGRAFTVSASLLDPPVTLAALLGLVFLVGAAITIARKRPVAAFGILFFFIAIAPESLLMPQYLFFGYRPILPMAGLLLVLADVLMALLLRLREARREALWKNVMVAGCLASVILAWPADVPARHEMDAASSMGGIVRKAACRIKQSRDYALLGHFLGICLGVDQSRRL